MGQGRMPLRVTGRSPTHSKYATNNWTHEYKALILKTYSSFFDIQNSLRMELELDIMSTKKSNITVLVNENVERALRQLKKKIEREGVVRDMKRIVYYESPTQTRRKRLMRAVKQNWMRMAAHKLI